jgi:ABC-type methionine transport system ATPase subunit
VAARQLQLTFPESQVTEPVIYQIIKQYDVVPSIRRANIANHVGFLIIELTGEEESIKSAIVYLEERGIKVSDAAGDIVAG